MFEVIDSIVTDAEKRAELRDKIVKECSQALHWIADSMRHPAMSRAELEQAQTHLMRAISAAAVLDPE